MKELIQKQREFFWNNQTKDVDFRIKQLKKLKAVIERFEWVLYIFGGFLLYTAAKLVFGDDDHVDPGESKFLKLVNRVIPTTAPVRARNRV